MFKSITVENNIPLAKFTTFKIGGPAKYFFRAKSKSDFISALTEAKELNIPVFVLGGGSNILVHDNGFDGLVVKSEMNQVSFKDNAVTAEAGALLNGVISKAVSNSLAGLEFAIGVPASVGGAVWANLGCRGSEISNVVETVKILDDALNEKQLSKEECDFKYRDSIFKHQPWHVLEVAFKLQPGNKDELRKVLVDLTKLKKSEQNVGEETAGCSFMNPTNSEKSAGQLIDELDLKGFQIGGAKVSERHANFIINTGNATADDVVQLISVIKQKVRDNLGVQLMEEIEYVGF